MRFRFKILLCCLALVTVKSHNLQVSLQENFVLAYLTVKKFNLTLKNSNKNMIKSITK